MGAGGDVGLDVTEVGLAAKLVVGVGGVSRGPAGNGVPEAPIVATGEGDTPATAAGVDTGLASCEASRMPARTVTRAITPVASPPSN